MSRYGTQISIQIDGLLNSYTQIFFSTNKVFAIILIGVSFIDFYTGLSGLISILVSNLLSTLIGYNSDNIKLGYHGFNSLLVGLGLGVFYKIGLGFLFVLVSASVLTLFVSIMLEGVIGKYGLPYLSMPFLIGFWMVTLSTREFSTLQISERGVFLTNELFSMGGYVLVDLYNWFSNLKIHESIVIYFRSLGAIFFQYTLFAGVVISIGLLIYSRIAFILSVVGFFVAYAFYNLIGGNFAELNYSYIGFNFVLTAIAIGGYFNIPSRHSFLWVIILTPLISITISSTSSILALLQLSIYSLPFNIIVLLFMYVLKFRRGANLKPEIVIHQQFSPEKNLYSHLNSMQRYADFKFLPIILPFWGEWVVTQGHHGEYTHKEGWAKAWDFEVKDDSGNFFKDRGLKIEDYYCYDKPVIAPADGIVQEIQDNIEDNVIGDVNIDQNWGNTIVIKHAEKLYTNFSHLKKGSAKVAVGDHVKKGDLIAKVGNSGRSPVPHLHFQFQETPFIGSETLDYPIGHYILKEVNSTELKSYKRPAKDDQVSNIEKNSNLYNAFHFVPGQSLLFEVFIDGNSEMIEWDVQSDVYNNTWIYCSRTNSKAWFKNDGYLHYFTHFEGNRKALLFYFYLGAYKVTSGVYSGLKIMDTYPVHSLQKGILLFLQDLIAPFYVFIQTVYQLEFLAQRDSISDQRVEFKTKAIIKRNNTVKREITFEFEIETNRIKRFFIVDGNRGIEAKERITN